MLLSSAPMKPRGLFGMFAQGDTQIPMPQGPDLLQQVRANMPQSEAPKKPGFFAEGGLGRMIAGGLGDVLAQQSGGQPVYMQNMLQQRALKQRQQMMQQQRANDWQDFQRQEQWKLDHQKPVNNDTVNDFNWYKGLSAEDQAIYDKLHPIVIDGPDGRYMVPRSAISGMSAPVGGGSHDLPQGYTIRGGGVSNGLGSFPAPVKGKPTGFDSYKSGSYDPLEAAAGREFGVPPGILNRLRVRGEKSNAGQVSEVGARSVYQITPETRQLIIQKYKFDPWANPRDAARGAAIVARDMYRKFGNWNDAMTGYHGGNDTRNWGKRTQAYAQRTNF